MKLLVLLISCILLGGSSAVALPGDYLTDVTDSAVLEILDKEGKYSLSTHLNADDLEKNFKAEKAPSGELAKLNLLRLHVLSKNSKPFQKIEADVVSDIEEFVRNSNVNSTFSVTTLSDAHKERPRHFDQLWLRSRFAAFKLVAVVNRIDRMDFDSSTCGELRFIYRLGYFIKGAGAEQSDRFSMLPVFLNFVFNLKTENGCQSAAEGWKINRWNYDAEGLATVLENGPLNKKNSSLKQIELNMQLARFSSGDKTDFGGSAVYLFRIWKPTAAGLVEEPLENTPDVTAVLKDPALKADLVNQLTDKKNLRAIDQGYFQLKNTNGKLLAKKALSFSTTGRARLGNKPFSFLFLTQPEAGKPNEIAAAAKSEFSRIDYSSAELLKSSLGLVERMDSMTCMGCHQANSTAGFHVLGRFFELDTKTNRVALAFSSHVYAEKVRRAHQLEKTALGLTTNKFRPLPGFSDADWTQLTPGTSIPRFRSAKIKDICIEPGKDLSVGILCEDQNSKCMVNAKNARLGVQYGECVVKSNASSEIYAGLSCRAGNVKNAISRSQTTNSSLPFNFFSFKDNLIGLDGSEMPSEIYNLPQHMKCGRPFGGIPLGRIGSGCVSDSSIGRFEFVDVIIPQRAKQNWELSLPNQMCTLRGGNHFDVCAQSEKVIECLAKSDVRRTMIDLCYQGKFCREDYLCQQVPIEISSQYANPSTRAQVEKRITELNRRNIGFCVPNYFVFNMRIDGHPLPDGRKSSQ